MLWEGEFQKAPWWPERLGVTTHGTLIPQHLTGCDPQSPDQITTFLILPPQRTLVGPQAAPPSAAGGGWGFPKSSSPAWKQWPREGAHYTGSWRKRLPSRPLLEQQTP